MWALSVTAFKPIMSYYEVPVASVGVNNWNQFCITEVRASMPTSVAHVTNHRTISRLRQFNEASVMRITFRNHKKSHVISQRIKTNVFISILFYDFRHTTSHIDIFIICRTLWHRTDNRSILFKHAWPNETENTTGRNRCFTCENVFQKIYSIGDYTHL